MVKERPAFAPWFGGHGDHIDVDIELRDALEYLSHKACGGGAALQGDQCDVADRADFGCAHDLFHPFLNQSGHVVKAGAFAAHEYRCVYCAHREQLFGLRGMGSVMTSLLPAKITSCSPTMVPPRTE